MTDIDTKYGEETSRIEVLAENNSSNENDDGFQSITTTRKELWAFYLYYVGNNGLSGFNFGPSQFQNLLFLAGYDPTQPPYTAPCGDNGCVMPILGKIRDS